MFIIKIRRMSKAKPVWDRTQWFKPLDDDDSKAKMDAQLVLFLAHKLIKPVNNPNWKSMDPLLKSLFPPLKYRQTHEAYYKQHPLLHRIIIAFTDVNSGPIVWSVRKTKLKNNVWATNAAQWKEAVNKSLRANLPNGNPNDDVKFFKLSFPQMHDMLQKAILSAPKNPTQMVLFRAQESWQPFNYDKLKAGDIIQPDSIWSTSLRFKYGYMKKDEKDWCCLFVITVPKGKRCTLYIDSERADLLEIVLAAKTKLRVDKKEIYAMVSVPYDVSKSIALHTVYLTVV
jgi:hypothetical protein